MTNETQKKILDSYLTKRVILEEVSEGSNVSEATLIGYDDDFAEFKDYVLWTATIGDLQTPNQFPQTNPRVRLARKVLLKTQIASMQSLDNVLRGRNYQDVFKLEETQ